MALPFVMIKSISDALTEGANMAIGSIPIEMTISPFTHIVFCLHFKSTASKVKRVCHDL